MLNVWHGLEGLKPMTLPNLIYPMRKESVKLKSIDCLGKAF